MPTASRPKNSTRNRMMSMTRYPSPASEANSGKEEEKWERSRWPSVIASAREAIQLHRKQILDGFVALLLAMTPSPLIRFQRQSTARAALRGGNVTDDHGFGVKGKEVAIKPD